MSSSEILTGVVTAIVVGLIGWLVVKFKDIFFKPKRPIDWYNFPPQEWKFTTDDDKKTHFGLTATHLFINRSIAHLEKIEIVFENEPEGFLFDETREYSEETRGNAFVITLNNIQRKEEITLKTSGRKYASVRGPQYVVYNGRKIKDQYEFKVVNKDKLVLPAWIAFALYLVFGFSAVPIINSIIEFFIAAS